MNRAFALDESAGRWRRGKHGRFAGSRRVAVRLLAASGIAGGNEIRPEKFETTKNAYLLAVWKRASNLPYGVPGPE